MVVSLVWRVLSGIWLIDGKRTKLWSVGFSSFCVPCYRYHHTAFPVLCKKKACRFLPHAVWVTAFIGRFLFAATAQSPLHLKCRPTLLWSIPKFIHNTPLDIGSIPRLRSYFSCPSDFWLMYHFKHSDSYYKSFQSFGFHLLWLHLTPSPNLFRPYLFGMWVGSPEVRH